MSALTAARRLPMWRAFGVRDFRLLWGSEAVSVIGDQFHIVALSWLVIDLTRSGLALGTVLIAAGVPRALLLLPFGVLADRRPPRQLMLGAHLARGVIVGMIAALVLMDTASLPLLALLGAAFGAVDALYMPAQQAFLPRTLEPERLPSANALLQGTWQLASVAGPPLAGAVIAVIGTGVAFVVDAASFFGAAVIVLLMSSMGAVAMPGARSAVAPAPAAPATDPDADGTLAAGTAPAGSGEAAAGPGEAAAEPSQGFLAAVTEGIRYVLGDAALRTTMLISLVLNFSLNGPAAVGMPWLAELRFHAGPTGLGLMSAAWAAGALAGTLLAGNREHRRPGLVLLGCVAIASVAMMAVGVSPSLPLTAAALAVMGVCIGYVNIVAMSWFQVRIPGEMMGRVMSLGMLMGFGITPLSLAISGAVIDAWSAWLFIGSGALVALVAVAAWLTRYPASFEAPPPARA